MKQYGYIKRNNLKIRFVLRRKHILNHNTKKKLISEKMGRVYNFICIYTNEYHLKNKERRKERMKRNKIKKH